jgi:hypothetical protein
MKRKTWLILILAAITVGIMAWFIYKGQLYSVLFGTLIAWMIIMMEIKGNWISNIKQYVSRKKNKK